MATSNVIIPNLPNFYNLALFVCHLFSDGQFRTAHILYDSNAFDGRVLPQIESICPEPIPLVITDTNQSSPPNRNMPEGTDYILQLVFFDPVHFEATIEKYKDFLTFYRAFVFLSVDPIDIQEQIISIRVHNPIRNSGNLVVQHDSVNNSSCVNYVTADSFNVAVTLNQDTCFDSFDSFDRTFGEFERMEFIEIHRYDFINGSLNYNVGHRLYNFLNYYHLHLNNSYFNMSWIDISRVNKTINQKLTLKRRELYNEISTDFDAIDEENA